MSRLRTWFSANLAPLLAVVLVIAASIAVIQTVRIEGFRLGPVAVKGLADRAAEAKGTKANLTQSEQNRETEQAQDRASYAEQSKTCVDRVSQAKAATRVIQEIIHAPSEPSQPADPRAIVGADRLRIVAGQTPGEAGVLPDRSNGTRK